VDDSIPILEIFGNYFRNSEFELLLSSSGEDAIARVKEKPFDVVVTDLRMQPVSGIEVIKYVKTNYPDTEVIVLTGYASLESSIDAIRYDVFDYVEKPVNLEKFSRVIFNAFEKNRLTRENRRLIHLLNDHNRQLETRVEEVTRELAELSVRDALTGLYNYRYLSSVVVAEVSRSLRYHRNLSLAMIDLDRFKDYNDCKGHQAGNEALTKIAQVMREGTRGIDTCVRYGGEEFAILSPETEKEDAVRVLQRICDAIRQQKLEFARSDGQVGILTISAGVAVCPADARTDKDLIRAADRALYRAKKEGRDRICLA
jgi:diguanylate cyclase (GGDEF)-like protein